MDTSTLPLSIAQVGDKLYVHSIKANNGLCKRLRELGFYEGETIRLIANNDPLICQIGNSRFGLQKKLAHCIMVTPFNRHKCHRHRHRHRGCSHL